MTATRHPRHMAHRAAEPRIVRLRGRRPLVGWLSEPPDRATDDIKACVVAFTVFLLLVIASSLQGPALRPIDRRPVVAPSPSPSAFHMGPVR